MADNENGSKGSRRPPAWLSLWIGMKVHIKDGRYQGETGVITSHYSHGAYVALNGVETPWGLPVFVRRSQLQPFPGEEATVSRNRPEAS